MGLETLILLLDEIGSGPSAGVQGGLAHELVAADLWHDLGPNNPVNSTGEEDRNTNDAVKVVWDTLVDRLSLIRWHEWCNDEVDVAEQEKDDDWERGAEWWCPAWAVVRSWVKVKMNQSTGNENVDNGQWVGNDVEDEVEGISWWWRQHDDNGDNPMFEKTDKWGVEWLVGSPETRPW